MQLPQTDFCGVSLSRLIVGGNPISGTSHVDKAHDEEMEDYYSVQNIKNLLYDCSRCGINAMQLRGDKHILRLIREFRQEGGQMHWIAQTAPEMRSFEQNVGQIAALQPAMIYLHGVVADTLFRAGEYEELTRRLQVLRATGRPVGLGTHMPQLLAYAEEHRWDVDFYMACVYRITEPDRQEQLRRTGSEDACYVQTDPPQMYKAIRSTEKPCLAFKILAGTRRCRDQQSVQQAYCDAYRGIKPGDCTVVGFFQKNRNEAALGAAYAANAIAGAAETP